MEAQEQMRQDLAVCVKTAMDYNELAIKHGVHSLDEAVEIGLVTEENAVLIAMGREVISFNEGLEP